MVHVKEIEASAGKTGTFKQRGLKKSREQGLHAFWFLMPALVIIGVFVIFPTIKLFYNSFHATSLMGGEKVFVGLDNYGRLMNDKEFLRSFKASVQFMVVAVPLQTAIALFMAVQVNKKLKGVGIYRSIYFLPVATSFMVVAYLWRFMYNMNFGLINEVLNVLGVMRINFLGNVDTALPSLIVTSVWKSWPFFMMIFLAGLKEIPNSLYESASIDGATERQKFWHITLPMLKRTTFFVVMITTMDSIVKVFVPVFAMTQGGPRGATDMLVHYIWRQAFRMNQVGYASAAAVIMFLFVMVISMIQLKVGDDDEE